MKYFSWLWQNSCGIRWNTAVRIVTGIVQVVLGLLMVWLSKRFIDETIRTGTADDVLRMVELLVLTVVGGVVLRQVGYWLKTSANVRQSNALRLRIFGRLFHRQLFTGDELHSGDVVLAWVDGNRYVVHRIINIDGDRVTLMGDGNVRGTEHCLLKDIKARVTHVVSADDRKHDLYNRWRVRAAKLWYWLRPIRRYLFAIYRRL